MSSTSASEFRLRLWKPVTTSEGTQRKTTMPGPPIPSKPPPRRTEPKPTEPTPAAEEPESRTILPLSNALPPATIPSSFTGTTKSVDQFLKLNRIGEGTYGIVYRAKDKSTGRVVALKRLRMDSDRTGMPIGSLREISILKSLRHENIVEVLDVVVGRGLENIFMVMEYCEQDMGVLMDSVVSKGSRPGYRDPEVKCLMQQLLKGLGYLHANYIIHRDLKLTNLLLTATGTLKIADFGLARKFGLPQQPMSPKVVTLWYRAPELLLGSKDYGIAVDMWSVGCIFGEFLSSKPLLPGKEERQQLTLICNLLGTPSARIWPGFDSLPYAKSVKLPPVPFSSVNVKFSHHTDSARRLLKGLLTYHPETRLTVKEALRHSYFYEEPGACLPIFLPMFPEFQKERDTKGSEPHRRRPPSSPGPRTSQRQKRVYDEEEELALGAPVYKRFRLS
ncbi:cyclin-dependent kinase 10-like protein [Fimicolochytrium jonesii]|uniref:cyclin-dependent kinase 10-like protein n=1 Tax=Fimicolochytrium jonesii TaxID=1396493 RepID=UPI0022FE3451|nr:cyclin-dependent kinase 10-like protein [Fimicolochytrium jonesii]KAI8821072.1 cyclin-dependent kinase 10-like protein [Fimicolochytrium jonesii]